MSRMLIFFISALFSSMSAIPIEHILGTNQYQLITQFKCTSMFQHEVPNGECPKTLPYQDESVKELEQKCDDGVRLHLVRDTFESSPPQILFVWVSGFRVYVKFDDLKSVMKKTNGTIATRDLQNAQTIILDLYNFVGGSKAFYSVYDWRNKFLYLLYQGTESKMYIKSFLLQRENQGAKSMKLVPLLNSFTSLDIKMNARYNWMEDPYAEMVYYTTHNGAQATIHGFPTSQFLSFLLNDRDGQVVYTFPNTRTLFSVSGGIVLSRNVVSGENKTRTNITTFFRSNTLNTTVTAISCFAKFEGRMPHVLPTIVVRDWDFCLLRNEKATRHDCDEQRRAWRIANGFEESAESTFTLVKWLVIAVVVLVFVVTLLLVYVYWLRSTFEAPDVPTSSPEKNIFAVQDEVSMFLARQRSFPSHYDHAPSGFMDVSVDKWN